MKEIGRRIVSLIVCLCMVMTGLVELGVQAKAEGASKSVTVVPAGYIPIYTVDDLYSVRNDLSANYILMNDIDLTEVTAEDGAYSLNGNGWDPIGGNSVYTNNAFTGVFDGNGHSITGMRISYDNAVMGTEDLYFGLFAKVTGTVANLTIEGTITNSINADYIIYAGMVAASASDGGSFDNCRSKGYVDIENNKEVYSGGIIGHVYSEKGLTISNCSNYVEFGEVSAAAHYRGGIIGYAHGYSEYRNDGDYSNCYINIYNCYNVGKINVYALGESYAGGIAGYTKAFVSIKNSYNVGDVRNFGAYISHAGGICGIANGSSQENYSHCYNIGNIYTYSGYAYRVTYRSVECYSLSGVYGAIGLGEKQLSETQMKSPTSYTGFDFDTTWIIIDESEYPYPQLIDNMQIVEDTTHYLEISKENFLDSSFRSYLKDYFDKNKDGWFSVDELEAVKDITLSSGYQIVSLEGVDKLTSLKNLSVFLPTVTSLDLGNSTNLVFLCCTNNNLSSLNISGCTSLEALNCYNTSISELDVSNCANLKQLLCNNTSLDRLDVSENYMLKNLDCSYSSISELYLGNNVDLEYLNCKGTNISEINLENAPELTELYCSEQIKEIDVSNCPKLETLDCSGAYSILELDVSKNPNLRFLYCNANKLSSLNVENNPNLEELNCGLNELTSLNVSKNPNLKSLMCDRTNIKDLDLSNNPKLKVLNCSDTKIVSLDISKCDSIENLQCTSRNVKVSSNLGNLIVSGTWGNRCSKGIHSHYSSVWPYYDLNFANHVVILNENDEVIEPKWIEHQYGEWQTVSTATCDKAGKQVRVCIRCKDEDVKIIEAIGHESVVDEGREPTCVEYGLTEGAHCEKCGKILRPQNVISAPGHDVVFDPEIPASCTQNGLTKGAHCRVCGEVLFGCEVIESAGGHNYLEYVVEPTTTSEGYTIYHCSNCNSSYLGNYTPMLTTLQLDKTSLILPTKESIKLNASVTPAQTLTWTSSDETVATVDANGVVLAKRYGNATITVTAEDGTSASCEVNTLFFDVAGSNVKTESNYQYYFDPVYWAASNGITTGYDKVYFGPENKCTRQELIIFLWRVAGKPAVKGDARKYFSDVKDGTNTATNKAIAWAYEKGITKGYTEGGKKLFKPKNSVTRQETMIFLWRVAGQPSQSGTLTFSDCKNLDKNSATYKAILWGSKNGITGGYPDGSFGLTGDCLREAIVTFLYRFNNKYNYVK